MKNLVLVIPCYNEEKRFRVDEIKKFIEQYQSIDFCFVNDGSSDGTAAFIQRKFVNGKNCSLLSHSKNLGKGNAIRGAMLQLKQKKYPLYGFIDADFEIPFPQVLGLLEELKNEKILMAITCRNLKENFRLYRHRSILSLVMVKMANRIIGLKPGLADTQCGNKIFRREILDTCFSEKFISDWLFDIEIFLRLKKKFPRVRQAIAEVPLISMEKSIGKSNFQFFENLKLINQLRLILLHYKK